MNKCIEKEKVFDLKYPIFMRRLGSFQYMRYKQRKDCSERQNLS